RIVEGLPPTEPIALPRGYGPQIDMVGTQPANKIMVFEGARYWNPAINGFDYSTTPNTSGLIGTPQGNFISRGSAFQGSGGNYFRDAACGYKPSDVLIDMSLRHSEHMNAGMFDGHVEIMNNLQSADPSFYVPSGSHILHPNLLWYFLMGPADSPYRHPN